ncbi:hypothetical protein Cst_c09670 [Thermoclostridium stercorarium subsp. stercorarium DSM 8532]|uniref:Uncharacterized protein n=3 Tax=Thermoclostridium stercorarium TaxID=1510 RepID=L7VIR6_THES1|nr:hypothetical protein Cst_c09670 [Thermoclostridium stercorarium subsp. stercorarium DSM 8532]ANW98367.1 hypothetical protein CSTERTH_04585 [Thermoclostridium stercorarium subsp. thermolacticum DSM 2910]ANX00903.1 hypothetical protein CSTERLE_04540 [Thermoclostridium stercorarium subsp. leptospartum DSM 9219]
MLVILPICFFEEQEREQTGGRDAETSAKALIIENGKSIKDAQGSGEKKGTALAGVIFTVIRFSRLYSA